MMAEGRFTSRFLGPVRSPPRVGQVGTRGATGGPPAREAGFFRKPYTVLPLLRDDPCSLSVFTCVHSENAVNAERSERRNENAHVNAESERRNAEFRTQGERGESERRI